jgi:hypothetical protein
MIVSTYGGSLQIIRQTDHAAVSGVLADNWGNETFRQPEPFAPVVLAAALHDNGWQEWEEEPKVNATTRLPYQFTELPVADHLAFYFRGVERVVTRDRYAGLLVNLHCSGLYKQRYGIDPSLPIKQFAAEEQQVVQQFIDRLEAQQRQLCRELRQTNLPPAYTDEATLWTNYKLLQIYDRLSLFLCMPPLRARELGPAPLDERSGDVKLALQPAGERSLTISPYPFRENQLRLTVEARLIPNRSYDSDADLRETLAKAERRCLTFELRGP